MTSTATIDHDVETLAGQAVSLASYRGKALLVVNTASRCGYTPQYAGLQELYAEYKDRGFEVLGFPSNDFGGQEPGSAEQIQCFVDDNYSVEFPMFAKVHARGPEIAPLYQTLTHAGPESTQGEVKWNFTKFLIDPEGHIVARFEPRVAPKDPQLIAALERVLPASQ